MHTRGLVGIPGSRPAEGSQPMSDSRELVVVDGAMGSIVACAAARARTLSMGSDGHGPTAAWLDRGRLLSDASGFDRLFESLAVKPLEQHPAPGEERRDDRPASITLLTATLGAAEAVDVAGKVSTFAAGEGADFVVVDSMSAPMTARRLSRTDDVSEKFFALLMMGDDRAVSATYLMGEPVYLAGRASGDAPTGVPIKTL